MAGPSTGTTNVPRNPTNSENQNQTVYSLGRHRMPKPGEKNAPMFDPDKPEELGRFFDRIEDWFRDDEIVGDLEKKRRIVRYLDADSEIQWKAFSKFAAGTYEEFKTQVMSSYPAAEEVMKGSVAALKRKIKKIGPVATDERDELLSLVRIMTAEVMKLKNITPPIHTNRELVELFLGRLTADFASRVAGKLSMHRLFEQAPQNIGAVVRNPEDMYDIEEVMDMAKHTSLEQTNPFGKFLTVSPNHDASSMKLEEAVARLTDSINLQAKYNQQVDQKLAGLQSFMNQPRVQQSSNNFGSMNQGSAPYSRGLPPVQNPVQGQTSGCFYCAGAHRIPDCEAVVLHLDLGWLKKVNGYLRLPDGSKLPRDPGKTTREVIEQLNKAKPGLIHMHQIPDKTSLYQASQNMSSFMQNDLRSNSGDAEMQHLLELVQKVGMDQAKKALAISVQEKEEEDEWRQNFE